MDASTLSAVWPVALPSQPEPLQGGINNRTFRVHTGSGDYILRIYPHTAKAEQIAFEMALLTALSRIDLPFQVPAPLPSRTGELAPTVRLPDGDARALLVPVIPGGFCAPSSPAQAHAAGAALGQLAGALQSLSVPAASGRTYADLEQIDPALPDPLCAPDLPFVDADSRKRLTRLLEDVLAERHRWYPALPRQIIHGDYVPFNLLMEGDRVTGVLDFELAGEDLRALDFAIGLWPWLSWDRTMHWDWAEAFSRGYTIHQPLTPQEVEALPFLLRLRRATTLVWWSGRYRRGSADESTARWAVTSALEMEDWMAASGAELLATAGRLV